MKRALVTGCSTGIGRATAIELTRRGLEVVATARRPETLDHLDVAASLALDVDDDQSVRVAVEAAGPVDVLVNNAGWGLTAPVESVPMDAVRAVFETNVFGVVRMVQAVAPGMRARGGGTIVNVSSIAGHVSTPLNGLYAATKHAVEAISEAMSYEMGHFGIRTVVVEPGYVATAWAEHEQRLGDDGPYRELFEEVAVYDRTSDEQASPPELVAHVIADAIDAADAGDAALRWPAGADAELILHARARTDDAEWQDLVRQTMGLGW